MLCVCKLSRHSVLVCFGLYVNGFASACNEQTAEALPGVPQSCINAITQVAMIAKSSARMLSSYPIARANLNMDHARLCFEYPTTALQDCSAIASHTAPPWWPCRTGDEAADEALPGQAIQAAVSSQVIRPHIRWQARVCCICPPSDPHSMVIIS